MFPKYKSKFQNCINFSQKSYGIYFREWPKCEIFKRFSFLNAQNFKFSGIYFRKLTQNFENSRTFVPRKILPLKPDFLKLFILCNSFYVRHLPNCFVILNKQGGRNVRGKILVERHLMEIKLEYPLVSNLLSTSFEMTL